MAVEVGPLHVTVGGANAASRSLASLGAVFRHERASQVRRDLLEQFISLFDVGDLFRFEPVGDAAPGTNKLDPIQLAPSDGYEKFVSAFVADGHADIAAVIHGWPILSVVDRTATVTEAGGAHNAPGGGLA